MIQAMILCAGFGTRMHDYTKDIPKPMLDIGGKPMLERNIVHLKSLGIVDIVINLHYLHEKITSYLKDGAHLGVNIKYLYEENPLGTAGAVKNAQELLLNSDNFLVLYGDIVTNQNYIDLLKFHNSKKALSTIILHERNRSNSIVAMNSDNLITTFIERPENPDSIIKTQNWVNSGLYCFNKKIFDYIPINTFCDFPKNVFNLLIKENNLYGFPLEGYRCAIDSPERYNKVKKDYQDGLIF